MWIINNKYFLTVLFLQESSSEVFAAKITKTYKFKIEPRSTLRVKQMKGMYGGAYNIFSEKYIYEVEYMDEKSRSYKSKPMTLDLDARETILGLANASKQNTGSQPKTDL